MKTSNPKRNKALWLEDQYVDLMDYSSRLARINFLVDPVKSVTETLEKLRTEEYDIYIFDLKILPGNDPYWEALDEKKRAEKPHFDPYLGLELLRFLDKNRKEKNRLWKDIKFDFSKVIVFSVVHDKDVYNELESFGITQQHIIHKSGSDLDTLPKLIAEMQDETYKSM